MRRSVSQIKLSTSPTRVTIGPSVSSWETLPLIEKPDNHCGRLGSGVTHPPEEEMTYNMRRELGENKYSTHDEMVAGFTEAQVAQVNEKTLVIGEG